MPKVGIYLYTEIINPKQLHNLNSSPPQGTNTSRLLQPGEVAVFSPTRSPSCSQPLPAAPNTSRRFATVRSPSSSPRGRHLVFIPARFSHHWGTVSSPSCLQPQPCEVAVVLATSAPPRHRKLAVGLLTASSKIEKNANMSEDGSQNLSST
ncbi:hypothetical protein AAHA92_31133 [Salvia divinorum]|uniref:Uncharacterized protein n=1 Tax=Salvia divinorum TaxID=28513 RepID=A0ABD1FW13_SALDI